VYLNFLGVKAKIQKIIENGIVTRKKIQINPIDK
jgi:hypothetical protein